MAATDLDPIFVKALRLLHSKSKDSAAQLKAMVDEAIALRKGLKPPAQSGDAGKHSPARSKPDDEYKRRESEKRHHEKSGKEASEPESKKSKLDSKHKSSKEKDIRDKEREKEKARRDRDRKEREEKEAQRQKEKAEKEKKEKEKSSPKQESEVMTISDEEEMSSHLDAGDFALEMGIACVVCKQFGVTSGNQLVECQECHSLYHQECHKPAVSDGTVNDPRYVWYCARCQKMLQKKQQQQQTKAPAKPATSLLTKETHPVTSLSSKSLKPEQNIPQGGAASGSSSQAFRKIDQKVIVPPRESSGQQNTMGLGLAGLAANLAKPQAKVSSINRKAGDGSIKTVKVQGSSKRIGSSSSAFTSKTKPDDKSSEKMGSSSSSVSSDRDKKSADTKSSSLLSKDDRKPGHAETSSSSKSLSSGVSSSSKHPDGNIKAEKKVFPISSSASGPKLDVSSSSSSSGLKLDVSSSSSSSSSNVKTGSPCAPTVESPGSPSKSLVAGVDKGDKNKKAMAMLSQITATKRMQMMMKKAQTKPTEKKHIK